MSYRSNDDEAVTALAGCVLLVLYYKLMRWLAP